MSKEVKEPLAEGMFKEFDSVFGKILVHRAYGNNYWAGLMENGKSSMSFDSDDLQTALRIIYCACAIRFRSHTKEQAQLLADSDYISKVML